MKYDYITPFRLMKSINDFINQYPLSIVKVRGHAGTIYDKALDYSLQPEKDYSRYYECHHSVTEKSFHLLEYSLPDLVPIIPYLPSFF